MRYANQPVLLKNGQAEQQHQLINNEIQIAQTDQHYLQLQTFDCGIESL